MIDRKNNSLKAGRRASEDVKFREADLKQLAEYVEWSVAQGHAYPEFRGPQFDRYDLENHTHAVINAMRKEVSRAKSKKAPSPPSKSRKGDISLLGNAKRVNFQIAEQYLGISARQRQILQAREILEVQGGGHNRVITVESLTSYLPPKKTGTNAK